MGARWLAVIAVAALGVVAWMWIGGEHDAAQDPYATDASEEQAPALSGRRAGPVTLEVGDLAGDRALLARVVDDAGTPVAGVLVELRGRMRDANVWGPPMTKAIMEPLPERRPLMRQTSGDDGRVRFEGLTWKGHYEVLALPDAPWCAVASGRVWTGDREVLLVLTRGVGLRARVVDAQGRGLRGYVFATVVGSREESLALQWRSQSHPRWALGPLETNADGRVSLGAVPESGIQLLAMVPGRGIRGGVIVKPPYPGEALVRLGEPGGGVIAGTVRGPGGSPVADATVFAASAPGDYRVRSADPEMLWQQVRRRADDLTGAEGTVLLARTDASGAYRIEGLPPGRMSELQAWSDDVPPVDHPYGGTLLEPGAVLQADFTLDADLSLRGRVQDEHEQPLAGVEVGLKDAWRLPPPTRTDAEGRFTFTGLKRAYYHVLPQMDGYFVHERPRLYVRKDLANELVITMRPGVSVSGRVIGVDGEPAAGATVDAQYPWNHTGTLAETKTDARGRFTLASVPAGLTRFRANGPDQTFARLDRRGSEPGDIVLKLASNRAGAQVEVHVEGASPTRPYLVMLSGAGSQSTMATRHDGSALFSRVKPGTYRAILLDAYERASGSGVAVTVPAEATTLHARLVPPTTHSLEGRILKHEGGPATHQAVRLSLPAWAPQPPEDAYIADQGFITGATDDDGRFAFLDLPKGTYIVNVLGLPAQEIEVPGATVQLRLPPMVRVAGRVFAPDGSPVATGSLSVYHRMNEVEQEWVDDSEVTLRIVDGRFDGEVAGGARFIDLWLRGAFDAVGERIMTTTSVVADHPIGKPDQEVHLEAPPSAEVAGVVVDADGKPVGGIVVSARNPKGGQRRTTSGADGAFRITGLMEGELYVTVVPPQRSPYFLASAIRAETGMEDLRISVAKGVTFKGRVVNDQGKGVKGRNVMFQFRIAGGWMTQRDSTDAEGRFRIYGIPADTSGRLIIDAYSRAGGTYFRYDESGIRPTADEMTIQLVTAHYVTGQVEGLDIAVSEQCAVVAYKRGRVNGKAAWVPVARTTTKLGGSFRVGPIRAKRVRIEVGPPDGYRAGEPVEVQPPAKNVVLTVVSDGTERQVVRGRVVGESIVDCVVSWIPDGDTTKGETVEVDETGTFAFRVDPAHGVTGTLIARSYDSTLCGLVRGAAPGDELHRIRLQEGLEIRGRIEGAGGSVTCQGSVDADIHGVVSFDVHVEADGTFVLRGLPALRYTLGGWVTLRQNEKVLARGALKPLAEVEAGTSNLVLEIAPKKKKRR